MVRWRCDRSAMVHVSGLRSLVICVRGWGVAVCDSMPSDFNKIPEGCRNTFGAVDFTLLYFDEYPTMYLGIKRIFNVGKMNELA